MPQDPMLHELHMEAEVPPVSKKSEAAQPENLGWGRGETGRRAWDLRIAGTPANNRLAQANKREAWQAWRER